MKDNQFDTFSVPLWGFILSDQHYQSLDYVEYLEHNVFNNEPSQKKSNSGGYQSRDTLNEDGIFKELVKALNNISNNILKEHIDNDVKQVGVTELWANINLKNNFNWAHTHSGILSGVFYLETPDNCGNLVFCNPATRSDGHLIRAKNYHVKPQRLACIMFPSWLEHYVEPNLSDDRRMSLSFNIG